MECLACSSSVTVKTFTCDEQDRSEVKVAQLCPILCDPMDYKVHGILQARVGSLSLTLGDLPNPGIEPRSPALQVASLPAELQGNPKNTEVGSLSLLQGIFLTKESNWGFLHCRQILYQLSYCAYLTLKG